MIRRTRLSAAIVFGAALTAAGVALAQAQTASTAPPAASGQPTPPAAQTAPPTAQPDSPATNAAYWDSGQQPTYSVNPPPGSSGVYLPAAILGYAKSAAGCVVVGCNDGPQAGGAAPSSPESAEPPPPADPGPAGPH
jgi:hypothetical protein